jgi:hypothetical protein
MLSSASLCASHTLAGRYWSFVIEAFKNAYFHVAQHAGAQTERKSWRQKLPPPVVSRSLIPPFIAQSFEAIRERFGSHSPVR